MADRIAQLFVDAGREDEYAEYRKLFLQAIEQTDKSYLVPEIENILYSVSQISLDTGLYFYETMEGLVNQSITPARTEAFLDIMKRISNKRYYDTRKNCDTALCDIFKYFYRMHTRNVGVADYFIHAVKSSSNFPDFIEDMEGVCDYNDPKFVSCMQYLSLIPSRLNDLLKLDVSPDVFAAVYDIYNDVNVEDRIYDINNQIHDKMIEMIEMILSGVIDHDTKEAYLWSYILEVFDRAIKQPYYDMFLRDIRVFRPSIYTVIDFIEAFERHLTDDMNPAEEYERASHLWKKTDSNYFPYVWNNGMSDDFLSEAEDYLRAGNTLFDYLMLDAAGAERTVKYMKMSRHFLQRTVCDNVIAALLFNSYPDGSTFHLKFSSGTDFFSFGIDRDKFCSVLDSVLRQPQQEAEAAILSIREFINVQYYGIFSGMVDECTTQGYDIARTIQNLTTTSGLPYSGRSLLFGFPDFLDEIGDTL